MPEALPGRAALQVYTGDARDRKRDAVAELTAALGLGAEGSLDEPGESLEELQGALLTAGLAAALERRPCETELRRALQRAAGEPEPLGSRRLQVCCSQWRYRRAFEPFPQKLHSAGERRVCPGGTETHWGARQVYQTSPRGKSARDRPRSISMTTWTREARTQKTRGAARARTYWRMKKTRRRIVTIIRIGSVRGWMRPYQSTREP